MKMSLWAFILLGCLYASMATSLFSYSSFQRTGFEHCDSDVIFVVDESSSIEDPEFTLMTNFIMNVVNELNSFGNHDIIYGLVTFSTGAQVEVSLSLQWNEAVFNNFLLSEISPQAGGLTATYLGINEAINDFDTYGRVDSKRIMIILTDGKPQNPALAAAAATDAKDNYDIMIIGVCVGCNLPQLTEMASEPKDNNVLNVGNFNAMSDFIEDLANSICPPRGRRICECDMVFVMDGSGSINEQEGVQLENFVKDVVNKIGNLGGNDVHFGSVVFSEYAAIRISLSQALESVAFESVVSLDRVGLGRVTKTHLGINLALGDLQTYGRNDTCWLMIILSDGEPCCSPGDDVLAKNAADNAKANGAEIFSVCIGTNCDQFQLTEMVSNDVDDHYLEADDTSKLNEYVQDLVDLLCPDPCFETPADIIFMLDHSCSVSYDEFVKVKNFVGTIASRVATSTFSVRIGVITFGSSVTHVIDLTEYEGPLMDDLDDAIAALDYGCGGTSIFLAMQEMIAMFNDPTQERHGARRVGVVVSDFGVSLASITSVTDTAKFYEGIEMVAISIGGWNPTVKQYIASEPKAEHMFQVCDFDDLDAIVDMMVKIFCIPSYCTHVPVDVVFVIDKSGSVEDIFMPMVKDFLKDVYVQLGIYTNDFRIGAVVYDGSAVNSILLNNQADMMDQIDGLPDTTFGWTDTVEALELMMQQFEDFGNEVAQWVAVVMTDGFSWSVSATSEDARAMSIKIVAIAIGDGISTSGLQDLVGDDGKVLTIKSYTALASVMNTLALFFCKPCEPSDVFFVIDETTSILENEYYVQLQFAVDMAYKLLEYPDNRVGYIAFSNIPYLVSGLTNDRVALLDAMNNRPYHPSLPTFMHYGIDMAKYQFSTDGRSDAEHIMVMLSDGWTQYLNAAISSAVATRNNGVRIAAISVTSNPNIAGLTSMISHPHSKYLFVAQQFVSLMKLENSVMKLICAPVCKDKISVMFVIDKSYSIHEDLFLEARDLVLDVADILYDNSHDVKLGALVFDGSNSQFWPTSSSASFQSQLGTLTQSTWASADYTNMGNALFTAGVMSLFWSWGYTPIVVMLSDGSPTDYAFTVFQHSATQQSALGLAVRYITVGIGPDVNEQLLMKVADHPVHENSIMTRGEELSSFALKLANMLCPVPEAEHRKICGEELIILEISMCCDGVPQHRPGGLAACCGEVSYNAYTHMCCDGEVQERTDLNECPLTDCFDTSELICCGAGAMSATTSEFIDCCGEVSYDTRYYVCCNGEVTEKVPGGDECCGYLQYNSFESLCCSGTINPRQFDLGSPTCCGQVAIYGPDLCCNWCFPPYVYAC